jgi:GNAT superfamily N-acetyltransferase
MAGAARDEDAAGLGEVQAIYLDPAARGRGLGRRSWTPPSPSCRHGLTTVVLWVLTANAPAGASTSGPVSGSDGTAQMIDFDGTPVEEIRYRRADSG